MPRHAHQSVSGLGTPPTQPRHIPDMPRHTHQRVGGLDTSQTHARHIADTIWAHPPTCFRARHIPDVSQTHPRQAHATTQTYHVYHVSLLKAFMGVPCDVPSMSKSCPRRKAFVPLKTVLKCVWDVSGMCLGCVWDVSGMCLALDANKRIMAADAGALEVALGAHRCIVVARMFLPTSAYPHLQPTPQMHPQTNFRSRHIPDTPRTHPKHATDTPTHAFQGCTHPRHIHGT